MKQIELDATRLMGIRLDAGRYAAGKTGTEAETSAESAALGVKEGVNPQKKGC